MSVRKLNEKQKEAVRFGLGPMMAVAGAGTGKTTVLTNRIIHLIERKGVKPEEILALTFTEKAAQEMQDRVESMLPFGYYDFWISTFHSFADKTLKNHGLSIGIPTDYRLLEQTGSWILMRKNFNRFSFLKEYRPLGNPTKFIHALISHFSHCKTEGIYPENYIEYAESLGDLSNVTPGKKKKKGEDEESLLIAERARIEEIAKAYEAYQQLLLDNSCLDFGDLINYAIRLFEKRPDVLNKLRKQFKYVLVDEFQDTNWSQYEMVKQIASPANNINVFADDDQSIFSFQGASFNNVLRFKKDYPNSKDIVLVENYRSPQNVLDLAYRFIQYNNPNRLEYQLNEIEELKKKAEERGVDLGSFKKIDKRLISPKKEEGIVELLSFETADEEITGVINKIWEIKEMDEEAIFSDFAILTRTNESADHFSRAMDRAGIPYQFYSSKGLYTHPLVLDLISYFKVLIEPYDSGSFYRILRMLPLDLSPENVAKITQYSNKKGMPIFEAIQQEELLSSIPQENRERLSSLIASIRKHYQISREKNVAEVFVNMLEDLGYTATLAAATEENLHNWEIIYQFYERIKGFENSNVDGKLISFVEQMQMELDSGEDGSFRVSLDDDTDAVRIMTVHSSKGLEFDYVFVTNLVHRKFPSDQKREPIEIPDKLVKEVLPEGDAHLQEERRLFYVALTRARKGLFLTWASDYGGKTLKKPSRFLIESKMISEEALEKQKLSRNTGFCFNRNFNFKLESNETGGNDGLKRFLPDHFSFSQLASFENCPLQYKFMHILKIPVKGKSNFSFGKTIHNSLHCFTQKSCLENDSSQGKCPDLKELLDIYKKEWINDWYEDKAEQEKFFEKGKEILERFYNDFTVNNPKIFRFDDAPALEKTFSLKIDGENLIGAIDRIDDLGGGVEIIDYKTGNPKTSLGTDERFQLLIYHLAAKKIFDLEVKKLTFHYIEDGSRFSFEPKEGEEEKTEDKISKIMSKIRRSNYKPTAGWHCQFCDFKNICSHRKN
ncbi:MAG: ATP-dependent DNA helicase PcrA [Parcubacteria group bacterium ADurb.Bin216]|nr:MAG: ATP-dependent DNA helicase PcrA [Parcubacteria group bacterium ADurb.Bin216]